MKTAAEIVKELFEDDTHKLGDYLESGHETHTLILLRRPYFTSEGIKEILCKVIEVDSRFAGKLEKPAPDIDAIAKALADVIVIANEIHDHWDADNDSKVGKMLLALAGNLPKYDKRIDDIHAALEQRP